jgi:exodeoxyribonuclease VII large subunit
MGTNFFDFREQVTAPKRKPTAVRPLADPAKPPAPEGGTVDAVTVSQLTSQIDRVIRAGFPAPVLVKGELSNYRPNASSGHLYFTLKDAGACIDCVMWKSDAVRVRFQLAAGMELLARGHVQVYGQQGRYQLYVSTLQPLGQGALELAFQQMRAKLEAEGLFAPERKRPLPAYPSRIVLVTSTGTAALQDMLKVLQRFPWVELFVYHVPVQGDGCGKRIADGLNHLSRAAQRFGGLDVVILSRGGGSLEDLWGFNEEAVARAVANCSIPVVTGIGHEVDTSIADLAADYHAHTPTEAAQVVTARWRGARDVVDASGLRLSRAVRAMVQHARQRLVGCERHEVFRRPLHRVMALRQLLDDRQRALAMAAGDRLVTLQRRVDALASALQRTPPEVILSRKREWLVVIEQAVSNFMALHLRQARERVNDSAARMGTRHPRGALALASQRIESLAERLRRGVDNVWRRDHQRVDGLERHLAAVSPEGVLKRGYSITTRKKDGGIVRRPQDVRVGERIVTRIAEGQVESVVDDAMQPRLFE